MSTELKVSRRVERELHQTKVLIRRFPPDYTVEKFHEQFSALPPHSYLYFSPGDPDLGPYGCSRAYINFTDETSIPAFRDQYDGLVLESEKGIKYRVVIEFAPFQGVPKKLRKKPDARCATIEQDSDYQAFLQSREQKPASLPALDFETYMEELKASKVQEVQVTPLISYLRDKKAAVKSKKKQVFVVESKKKKTAKDKSSGSREKGSQGKKTDIKEGGKKKRREEERVRLGKKFDAMESDERGGGSRRVERRGGERRGGDEGQASAFGGERRGSSQHNGETEGKGRERERGGRKPDRPIYVPRSREHGERSSARGTKDSAKQTDWSQADINWPSKADGRDESWKDHHYGNEPMKHSGDRRYSGHDYSSGGRPGEQRGRGRGRGKGRGRGRGRGQYDYQENTRSSSYY